MKIIYRGIRMFSVSLLFDHFLFVNPYFSLIFEVAKIMKMMITFQMLILILKMIQIPQLVDLWCFVCFVCFLF
jgi:hypothetical protein